MANWLDKALGRQSAHVAVEQVPFELECDCGKRLSGVRGERGRRVICKECGRAQFVLPINPYPVTSRQFFQADEQPEDEDQDQLRVVDDGAEDQFGDDMVDQAFGKTSAGKNGAKASGRSGGRRSPVAIDTLEAKRSARPSSQKQVWIIGGVFAVVAGSMLMWAVWSHQREHAERIFKDSSEFGLAAFANGDFPKAELNLEEAVQAADWLGLNEVQSGTIRSRRWHASAANHLADIDLFEIVSSADRMASQQWNETFASSYRDKWVILSAPAAVGGRQDGSEQSQASLVLRGSRTIRVAGIEPLLPYLKGALANTEVLFAGCLQDCRKDNDGWVVTFKPGTAVLWQDAPSLGRLGMFSENDERAVTYFRSIIDRQVAAVQATAKAPAASDKKSN